MNAVNRRSHADKFAPNRRRQRLAALQSVRMNGLFNRIAIPAYPRQGKEGVCQQ